MDTENRRTAGYGAHREAQRLAWLRLSHRQRLDWLQHAKRFAARALAAARARRTGSGTR
jgi:hypothetical protein